MIPESVIQDIIYEFIIGSVILSVVSWISALVWFFVVEIARCSRSKKSAPMDSTPRTLRARVFDSILILVGSVGLALAIGHHCIAGTTDNSLPHRMVYDRAMWHGAGSSVPLHARIFMSSSLLDKRYTGGTWDVMGATLEAARSELGPGELLGGGRLLRYPLGACRLHGRPWGYHDAYLELVFDEGKCVRAKVQVGGDILVHTRIRP